MQANASEAIDIAEEPEHIVKMYGAEPGKPSFANICLMDRRLVERGVRFVEIFREAWDQHGDLVKDISKKRKDTDQASAALITDLKQRGMLDDTLVVWGGEFDRTPLVAAGSGSMADGRDHRPNAFTTWLARSSVKPGLTLRETDGLGLNVTKNRVHVRDLHTSILHLLGFDHEYFTFKSQGLDQELAGVEPAHVVKQLLA